MNIILKKKKKTELKDEETIQETPEEKEARVRKAFLSELPPPPFSQYTSKEKNENSGEQEKIIINDENDESQICSYIKREQRVAGDYNLSLPFLFIHIPKTGGSSLVEILRKNFMESMVHIWGHPKYGDYEPFIGKDLIIGHFKYGAHIMIKERPYTYMTFVRDPVDRVISHYYYHREYTPDKFHQLAMNNSLKDWLSVSIDANNDQTQFLAGYYGVPNDLHAYLAKLRLIQMGFVGLTEYFPESLVLMKHFLGMKEIPLIHTKRTRTRPSVEEISEEVKQEIRKVNRYDYELYYIAEIKFQEQIDLMGWDRFAEETKQLKEDIRVGAHLFG